MQCRHCGVPWEYDWEYCPECNRNYGGAVYPATQTDEELRDVAELIRRIREAFAGVSRGEGETIHQAHLEGIFGRDARWAAEGAKDPESDWTEVPDWKLEQGASTLTFFDLEGWRFYLPAFLCWSLRNWRTAKTTTVASTIWTLTLRTDWPSDPLMTSERFASLDLAQSEAVHDFLAFFDKYSGEPDGRDARKAIRSYWHRFEKR
ncbi:DUF6714 family protein [Paludisphaera soli]|uniref:DUF6714 family protein n=1 Tax=Paludisphaera soli TaxID=2712865 RepID=UPI0013EDC435|nr:DUF6714 family protein [Paludisphaera soli]